MKRYVIALLLICAITVMAQQPARESLPDYGDISDLAGLNRVYVTADTTDSRKAILKELEGLKTLSVQSSPELGEFVIECREIDHGGGSTGSGLRELPTLEMTVYRFVDGKKRIVWSKTKSSIRSPAMLLTRDFIKALKKSRGK